MAMERMEDFILPELRDSPVYLRLLAKLQGHPFFAGRNRMAIVLKRGVLKVPMNFDGFTDNDWEGSVSNSTESLNNPHYIQYPHTRLRYVEGVPLLFMEYVHHASNAEVEAHLGIGAGESNWTHCVDGGQVGFTKAGRLVAYDYGPR